MKKQTWHIPFAGPEYPESLLQAGYNKLLAAVLASKDIRTPEEAKRLTECKEDNLIDPFMMKGMDQAIERLRLAVENRDKVVVYGDYDVDGITSTCLMTEFLRSIGLECKPYIPDRINEGYGLNCDALKAFKEDGFSLIVTVDCGITAEREALYAASIGVDLIITDHHECSGATVPQAVAVIDCKQPQDRYPFKDLCGVGVALKVACAYTGNSEEVVSKYCDLVAIGTIADVMPLYGENRYMVQLGLEKIRKKPSLGLQTILRDAQVDTAMITSATISYSVSPRLNAAGRLGNASLAAELLMTDDQSKADQLSAELCRLNRQRQDIEVAIWKDAASKLPHEKIRDPIVLESEEWNQGVIGIAASRLAEQHAVPTVMICLTGDTGKGSCRSYSNFNIYEALKACSAELISFGGHASAAGLNISRANITTFKKAFSAYYRSHKPDGLPDVDCGILLNSAALLNQENVCSLDLLEPYGNGNEKTVFCFYDVFLESVSVVGNGKHLRIRCKIHDQTLEGIFFGHTPQQCGVRNGDRVDVAFVPQVNHFRGTSGVQLYLSGLRRHNAYELCKELLTNGYTDLTYLLTNYSPSARTAFVKVWHALERVCFYVPTDIRGILEICPRDMSKEQFCICLHAFYECGLLVSENGKIPGARKGSIVGKADLFSSPVMTLLKQCEID